MKYHSNLARFIRGINNEIVETGDYTTTFKGGIDSKTEYIFFFKAGLQLRFEVGNSGRHIFRVSFPLDIVCFPRESACKKIRNGGEY